jgi:hypothetical protein
MLLELVRVAAMQRVKSLAFEAKQKKIQANLDVSSKMLAEGRSYLHDASLMSLRPLSMADFAYALRKSKISGKLIFLKYHLKTKLIFCIA